jgi:predicted glycogen debranching enzyme
MGDKPQAAPPVTRPANVPIRSSFLEFGREICGDLRAAREREWLVTNGIGGYASGTIAGLLTRCYHGLLVAALNPPLGRTLLVAKVDETADYDGQRFALGTNAWTGGAVDPHGYQHIQRFRMEGAIPVWTFACGPALVEKRVWMEQDANTTYVSYWLARANRSLRLAIKVLVNYCEHHSTTRAESSKLSIAPVDHGLRVVAFDRAAPFYLLSASATAESAHIWYRNFDLAVERERGLNDRADHLHAGTFLATLEPGQWLTLVFSTDPAPNLDGRRALDAHLKREQTLLDRWDAARPSPREAAPPWVRQLALAADQFIVQRPLADESAARSVIAGYHWFGEWGRDTMIALPGLALSTGRPEIARSILRAYPRFVDRGMLPNVFSDASGAPEYNTVDATLWYFDAVRQYYAATSDAQLLRDLFPVLSDIVDWHVRGTRYSIHTDPSDGLLYAGEPSVQLTWMDARVGDRVVTPRIGKPVEINALWLNALVAMTQFAIVLGRAADGFWSLAQRAREGFQRFWNETAQCCFDVLDGPEGNDATLRPNQIFAVSLPVSPLSLEQQRAVVEACASRLLTSHGLRSLAPDDPQYRGQYVGGPADRDGAYHQGTVWGWLLGPFALAHLSVHGDPNQAATFLEPMADHMKARGLGTAGEIFDGDPPFTPRGCIAQAWTVAELLRAWTAIEAARAGAQTQRTPASQAARSKQQ